MFRCVHPSTGDFAGVTSSSLLFMPWQRLALLVSLSQLPPGAHSRDGVGPFPPPLVVPLAPFCLSSFFLTAVANATPVLYLDSKRPPGNFPQGLVPPVNQRLLGQDPRGRVTQDGDFHRLASTVGVTPFLRHVRRILLRL